MIIIRIVAFCLAFGLLWYGSGLVFDAVKRIAKKLHLSSFGFSFFVLGLLTSVPEIGVGINALSEDTPEIFIGNLLGSIVVMFLLVIPLLSAINNGIAIKHHMSNRNLAVTLGIISVPALFLLDGRLTPLEGFVLIGLYIGLLFLIKSKQNMLERVENLLLHEGHDVRTNSLVKLTVGVVLVFIASHIVVDQTLFLSGYFNWSTFIVSLLILSVGTNLPEISLAFRSLNSKAEDIALGDYLGSAAANTLLFGIFTLMYNDIIILDTAKSSLTFGMIALGLGAFYLFSRGKSIMTKKESIFLLGVYLVFITLETLIGVS